MKVDIIHEISPINREIYHFNVSKEYIDYEGISISYRNDENDIWGDEWSKHYKEKEKTEKDEVWKQNPEYDGCWWDEIPCSVTMQLEKIHNKYNPVLHKTIFGKTYYGGSFGANNPPPKITETEIRKRIKEEVDKRLTNAKLML